MLFQSQGRTGLILIAVQGPIDGLIAEPEVISKCWILLVSGPIYLNPINTVPWVRVDCYIVPPLFLG